MERNVWTEPTRKIGMYLHIGGNVYVWSEAIVGIFEASFSGKNAHFNDAEAVNIIHHDLRAEKVKTYVLTTANEIHWSNVSGQTLKKRWKLFDNS